MREITESETHYAWVVYAVATLVAGLLGAYALSVEFNRPAFAPVAAVPPAASAATLADEAQLEGYRNILANDPKNRQAAVQAANLLYDAHRYAEAIPFYQQAFALDPKDVNVSTDLGTALWYSGRADDALDQYARSLTVNPSHVQTLLNAGIVRAEGKRDYIGAIRAWDALLAANPGYQDAARVRSLIADARQKAALP